jgi:hypothetical protein
VLIFPAHRLSLSREEERPIQILFESLLLNQIVKVEKREERTNEGGFHHRSSNVDLSKAAAGPKKSEKGSRFNQG